MRRTVTLVLAGLLVMAMAVPAFARPTKKGTTFVTPSAVTMTVLNGVTAPGALDVGGAEFGIVGRDYPASDVIKHVGGLDLATALGDVEIRDFWIDTAAGTVSAYVPALDVRIDLFVLADVETSGGDLTATLVFNGAASNVIAGDDSLIGESAGTALVDLP